MIGLWDIVGMGGPRFTTNLGTNSYGRKHVGYTLRLTKKKRLNGTKRKRRRDRVKQSRRKNR